MVTKKRYFRTFKKPLRWKGGKRFLRYVVLPAFTAVVLMLVVRTMFFTQFALSADQPGLDLMNGDRVLVNRAAYGLHLPFEELLGTPCYRQRDPQRGDIVAYYAPDGTGEILVDSISGLPGDTVTTPQRGILPAETYLAGASIVSHQQLVGRIVCITYSVDPDARWWQCLRQDRLLLKAYYD
ncbi:MAG: S26 family signal peptidase [Bacteroidales bacterium]|nr:S26 family signal peptidase [Bacteroidales bacterium]